VGGFGHSVDSFVRSKAAEAIASGSAVVAAAVTDAGAEFDDERIVAAAIAGGAVEAVGGIAEVVGVGGGVVFHTLIIYHGIKRVNR
jgi:hypothetical protein